MTSSEDYSTSRHIQLDGVGNVFTAGDFRGLMSVDGTTLTSPQTSDSYLAKYTPAGKLAWIRHFSSTFSETIVKAIAVDASGNCYVAGYYLSPGVFLIDDALTLTSGGSFLVKFNPQGTMLWVRGEGDGIHGLACTPIGEVVVLGDFYGTQVFGNTTLTSPPDKSSSFVVKYDAQGMAQWAQQFEGRSNDEAVVSLDAAGNACVATEFQSTATLGPLTLTGSSRNDDVFVARYSAAGVPQWVVRHPSPNPANAEGVWSMATDAAGNVYLTSDTTPDTAPVGSSPWQWAITQYTPQGTIGWNYLSAIAKNGGISGVATDATGNVYLSGGVVGTLSLGGLTLTSSSDTDTDLALLSFTAQGAPRWALRAGATTGLEYALRLALDAANNIYVTGALQGHVLLGSLVLPQHSPSYEQFVAKASISTITAAQPTHNRATLQLYPNPASDATLQVRWRPAGISPAHLLVEDALGRCVLRQELARGQTEVAVPVYSLAPGVYSLRVESATTTVTARFIKE
ncbi:T9SS type A sorting domain-containing protein [Hymenobacter sp. GOD-10R]|uniref:T9SS type A sorting domain-containing protein n=1 Tax=Hymenobacter sp. GOD-10R TaxID=3093922 RepID=UPI002D77366F|nr:T9SS type A sorting domain-containing protein [Hymenobacter sp. GOD-10R]WRQ32000.1 T9SS type A sorting domain-containing protein [Hymenobacter sp. GOD-10R]